MPTRVVHILVLYFLWVRTHPSLPRAFVFVIVIVQTLSFFVVVAFITEIPNFFAGVLYVEVCSIWMWTLLNLLAN
jgi:hypothetical protein